MLQKQFKKVSAVFSLFLGVALTQECPNLANSKKCDNDAHEDSDCRYYVRFSTTRISCAQWCTQHKMGCVGMYDDIGNSCNHKSTHRCDYTEDGDNDFMCECTFLESTTTTTTTTTVTPSATSTSTTSTITTHTYDNAISEMGREVAELQAAAIVTKRNEATIAEQRMEIDDLKAQNADQSTEIADLKARVDNDQNDRITALETQITALLAAPVRPTPEPQECTTGGNDCPAASMESDGAGTALKLNNFGGSVVFNSDECTNTDLCQLWKDVQALLAKFSQY